MQLSTTSSILEKRTVQTIGPVFGEVLSGINFLKDIGAGLRDILGGRSKSYENEIIKARELAIEEMIERAHQLGANAIVGIKVDIETFGQMMLVAASGTAVVVE